MPREFIVEDIHGLMNQLREYHSEKRGNQVWDDDFYEQRVEKVARKYVPSDIPIFQSSLSTDVVDTVSDSLRTDEPVVNFRVSMPPEKELEEGEEPGEEEAKIEAHRVLMVRWGDQLMRYDREMADMDAYSEFGRNEALRGEGIIKRLHNSEIPEKPVRTDFGETEDFNVATRKWKAEMATFSPLLPARPIDPLNIYLPPNAVYPLPYIIEYQIRRQIDLWEDYPEWRGEVANKLFPIPNKSPKALTGTELDDPTREVMWLEFWSESHYIVHADGVEVIKKKNPYGFVPYINYYSGLGRTDERGSTAKKAASILSKIRGEIESEIVLKTIMFELAKLYVFPRLLVPEGEEDRVAKSMGARGIVPYGEGGPESIKWLESPPLNATVGQFLAQAQTAISKRVNPIQRGMGEQDSEFGVLEALRLGQATKGIQDIANNLNRAGSASLNMAARMMFVLDLEMNVQGNAKTNDTDQKVTGSDFTDFNFEVEFKAVDPVEETRLQQAGMVLFRGGAMSLDTNHRKFLAAVVDDPEEEADKMMEERVREAWYSSPEFIQYAVQVHQATLAATEADAGTAGIEESLGATNGNLGTVEQLAGGSDALAAAQGPLAEAQANVEAPTQRV